MCAPGSSGATVGVVRAHGPSGPGARWMGLLFPCGNRTEPADVSPLSSPAALSLAHVSGSPGDGVDCLASSNTLSASTEGLVG